MDTVVSNESKVIQTEDYDYINRNVSDSLFENATIIFEQNTTASSNMTSGFNAVKGYETFSTNSMSSDVYTTAPTNFNSTSLRLSDPEVPGLRFGASVTVAQRTVAYEYGFIICLTSALENSGTELTFENEEITFVKGIAYNSEQGIDVIYDTDGYTYSFTGVLVNIPKQNYVAYLTARPYIIYNVEGTLTTVYGSAYSSSVYRTAKSVIASNTLTAEQEAVAMGYVLDAEDAVSLSTAIEVDIDDEIERNIGKDPDIDIIKVCPTTSAFYKILFNCEKPASFEVVDAFGFEFTAIEIEKITHQSAYLFEEDQTYYIRVRGEPDSEYSINARPCLENAIILDFANDTEGLTFGGGASGTVENGILNVSIDKSISLTQAFIQKNNFPIDLLEYSRLIVRLKNPTDQTTLSGTISIDLEYDDSYLNYTLDSSMPSNMTNFENVEFDCTTRYGMIRSLKFGVGPVLASFSGNVYIDSIAILPMPEIVAWEFDETLEEWSSNDQIDSMTIENGILSFDVLGRVSGMTPAITSPSVSAYKYDDYNVLKIRLKNESDAEFMQIYFSTLAEGNDSFSESKKFIVDIEPDSNQFVEYTIMLTEHELFTDCLKGIMLSIPGEGSVSIDYIRLFTFRDVVWDFDDNTLQGFYSSNNRHILSPEDGSMFVEKTDLNSGGMYSPSQLNLPTSEYRYLTLGINSASENSLFELYFKTDNMSGFSANNSTSKIIYKHVLNIKKSDTYKKYVIDLAYAQEGWTSGYAGNLQQLMMAFVTSGYYEIDYIMLSKERTSYEDVEWDFDDNTLQGFYSGNERHNISSNNGIMTVQATELTNGGIYTPNQINQPSSEYRYLVFGISSASSDSRLEVYYKSTSMNGHSAYDWANQISYKQMITIQKSDTFTEYIVDLSYAPEGWTAGYEGTIDNFMMAFLTPGTYEIDYIKLTNDVDGECDNESHIDEDKDEADETISINATKDFEYKVVISKNNNQAISTYTLDYDNNVFELVDACAFTYPTETGLGQVVGTDITIISAAEGTITFSVSNNTASGVINCLTLKALRSAESHISVTANVEQ